MYSAFFRVYSMTPFSLTSTSDKTKKIAAKIGGKKCESLPLHIASRNGCDSEILKMLFEAYPAALEKKNSSGDTPYVCGEGHGTCQKSLNAMTQGMDTKEMAQ
jgi:hypothetical protein